VERETQWSYNGVYFFVYPVYKISTIAEGVLGFQNIVPYLLEN